MFDQSYKVITLFFPLCLKDGEELAADENVEIAQHGARCSVTIVCPEGEDSGIYTCLAYNDSGHASCQAQLTVEEGETTTVLLYITITVVLILIEDLCAKFHQRVIYLR